MDSKSGTQSLYTPSSCQQQEEWAVPHWSHSLPVRGVSPQSIYNLPIFVHGVCTRTTLLSLLVSFLSIVICMVMYMLQINSSIINSIASLYDVLHRRIA